MRMRGAGDGGGGLRGQGAVVGDALDGRHEHLHLRRLPHGGRPSPQASVPVQSTVRRRRV